MIRCEHIYLRYGNNRDILRDVNLDIPSGSFHFITGASGAGKSSLLNLFSLALHTSRGKFSMFGKDIGRTPTDALPMLRRRIGVVYQDFRLLNHLTVEDNVSLPLKITGEPKAQMREKVSEMLSWVGLADFRNAYPETLSGGQKQRVAIARAVMNNPDIILADEPSGNLDLQLSLRFMHLFEELYKMGTTVILATHDENLISNFNYPVIRLTDGTVTHEAA